MKHLKQVFGGNLQQYTMALALILLVAIFNVTSNGRMLTSSNFQNLISGNAYVLVLAIGMVMVIVVGHIDLSVGSVSAFVGMCVAISIKSFGLPWWAALLLGLAIGALVGAWHGFWLAKMGIPGFITTLAGMLPQVRGGWLALDQRGGGGPPKARRPPRCRGGRRQDTPGRLTPARRQKRWRTPKA